MDIAIFQSLQQTQISKMKDSRMIVFDLMKEDNLYVLDPYSLILFLTKKLPAIPGVAVFLGPKQHKMSQEIIVTSFRPSCLERDDAIVLIKSYVDKQSPDLLEIVIKELIAGLSDEELINLGYEMQKFVVKQTTMNEPQKSLIDRIMRMNLGGRSITRSTKMEILSLWFSNAITGPFCITRALDLIGGHHLLNSNAVSCSITRSIQDQIGSDKFWNYSISYLLVTDPNYYIISGDINERMHFPREITYNYIGLKVPGIKYNVVAEKTTHRFTSEFLQSGEEFYVEMVFNLQTKQRRLKLEHGVAALGNLHSLIIHVANSTRFDKWCRNAVEWEIWFGRDEQTKLNDYRVLKEQNKQLARQVIELQRQLLEKNNGNSSSDGNGSMDVITDSDIEVLLNSGIRNEIDLKENEGDLQENEGNAVIDVELKENDRNEIEVIERDDMMNEIDLKEMENMDNSGNGNIDDLGNENENDENKRSANVENLGTENVENERKENIDNLGNENENDNNKRSENADNLGTEEVENKRKENIDNLGNENENDNNKKSANVDNLGNEDVENKRKEYIDNLGNENENENNKRSENVDNLGTEDVENKGKENTENLGNENDNKKRSENIENLGNEIVDKGKMTENLEIENVGN